MNRFLSVALGLLALVAPLAGCDLTEDQGEVYSGPTVEFVGSSATASEGGQATVTLRLNGTSSTPVTADVLFATGASSATIGDDFTGFGPGGTGLQTQTVTFSGQDGETQTITFDVPDDATIEAAEQAVFAIQNVQNARVGAQREFTLVIGTLPIATIRQFPDNASATVEGIVTRARGRFVYVQDATAAIVIFSPANSPLFNAVAAGEVEPGDRIQVAGTTDIFRGLYELSFVTAFEVLAEDQALPAAQTVTLAQIAADVDAYESELLRIANLTFTTADVVFTGNTNYTVTDPTGTFILRVPNAPDSDAPASPVPTGPTTFTGVLGQFDATGQLTLVNRSDLTP